MGPLAVNQDMLCAKILMQAIEYKIKAKDLVARVCRAEKRRAAAARSCCAPSGSSTIMLCANAADGLKGSTLRLGRMLASEMAAKVIDCDRNNDLGPLHAQISEGVPANTNVDLPAGPHIWSGQQRAAQHRPQKLVLRRKERPVMNKTGECFVKHVY